MGDSGLGELNVAPLDVLLDDRNVVQPDLLFVSHARAAVPRGALLECWIVDPVARAIEEYDLAGEVYRVANVAGDDDDVRPALFPGFAFRLATVGWPAPTAPPAP